MIYIHTLMYIRNVSYLLYPIRCHVNVSVSDFVCSRQVDDIKVRKNSDFTENIYNREKTAGTW